MTIFEHTYIDPEEYIAIYATDIKNLDGISFKDLLEQIFHSIQNVPVAARGITGTYDSLTTQDGYHITNHYSEFTTIDGYKRKLLGSAGELNIHGT